MHNFRLLLVILSIVVVGSMMVFFCIYSIRTIRDQRNYDSGLNENIVGKDGLNKTIEYIQTGTQ